MAMQFGRRVGSFVRANNFSSSLPTSLRPRSYFSGSQFPVPDALHTAFSYAVEVSGFAYGGWLMYSLNLAGIREKIEDWKAGKRVQEMLENLDREKYPSADSYLEALEREFNALKARALERDTDCFRVRAKTREVKALKSKFHAWANNEAKGCIIRSGTRKGRSRISGTRNEAKGPSTRSGTASTVEAA